MELTPAEKRVRIILASLASQGSYIFYQHLCSIAQLPYDMSVPYDRILIGGLLGNISIEENSNGRPLLSSIVLNTSLDEGDGFYRMASGLGFGKVKELKKDKIFMCQMINETHKFWQSKTGKKLLDEWLLQDKAIND